MTELRAALLAITMRKSMAQHGASKGKRTGTKWGHKPCVLLCRYSFFAITEGWHQAWAKAGEHKPLLTM